MKDESTIGNQPGDLQDNCGHREYGTGGSEIVAPAAAYTAQWHRIPAELRERPQWLVADLDKKPLSVTPDGRSFNGSTIDSRTWLPFEIALGDAWVHGLGIGYVLSADDPYTCIDLDVKDETTPEQVARFVAIQKTFDSYSERSRSGRGLHIWIKANIGPGRKRDGVEVYSEARFIICTGDVYELKPIADRQELASQLAAEMGPTTTCDDLVELPAIASDEAVYWKARSFEPKKHPGKFDALWRGEWRELGYPSQSEADQALIWMLADATPSNEQVRRLFRLSGLGQRKKAQRDAYLNYTLRKPRAQQAWLAQVQAACPL